MQIGIIGSGNVGATLTRRLQALEHEVTVANSRGPETLASLAAKTGAQAGSIEEAAGAGDLVVLAVPVKAVPELPAEALAGKVVVDANNYYPDRDGPIAAIDDGTPSSRWTADHLGGATVIKAFNTMRSQHLHDFGREAGDARRVAVPVAGDDEAAKERVLALVEELGFDAVDAGGLDDSWRQQPGTPVYGADLDAGSTRDALAAATRG